MTDHPTLAVVTDDRPRVAALTDVQSTLAVAERDVTLLVAAVATVLNAAAPLPLDADDHRRLRRLNAALFRALSAGGQRDVRERTTVGGTELQRSA